MPLKSKRSPPKKKPEAKAKVRGKPLGKVLLKAVKSKPKIEAKSPPQKFAKSPPQSSIFWKILAERERRQEKFPPKSQFASHRGTQYPKQSGKHEQFARFAGPRRRAA